MTRFLSNSSAILASSWPRLALVQLLLFSCFTVVFAHEGERKPATPEYQLKAALLYKLTKFIEWPERDDSQQQFNICIIGDNVFGDALEPLKERQVSQKSIEINHYTQSDEIDRHCDLLFIEKSKQPFLSTILAKVDKPGILTISDIANFAEQGGIVELTLVNNKIGFRINLQSSKAAELSIAAPLLQLATIVEGNNGD